MIEWKLLRKAESALLCVILVVCMVQNVEGQIEEQPDDSVSVTNVVFLEIGGAGLIYSLNYQLVSPPGFLLRFGASYLSDDSSVTLFPLAAGWQIPVSGIISVEISGGITFVNSNGSIIFNKGSSSFGHTFLGLSTVSKSKLQNDMFRIGVSPLILDGELGLWGSVSMGFTF